MSARSITIGAGTTFDADSKTITITGDDGTYSLYAAGSIANPGAVAFNNSGTGLSRKIYSSGGACLGDLSFTTSGSTTWTLASAFTASSLTVNPGATLTGGYDATVSGNVTGDGAINMTGGAFTLTGNGSFGGATDWAFHNLTFGDGSTPGTTTKAGANNITVNGQLTIKSGHTLQEGTTASTRNLTWGGVTFTKIAAGSSHTVALDTTGKVYAWGRNLYGQLGDGTNTNSNVPVAVYTGGALSGKTVSDIAAVGYTPSLSTIRARYTRGDATFTASSATALIPIAMSL